MSRGKFRQIVGLILLASLACTTLSCTVASSNEVYYGNTTFLRNENLSLRHRRRTESLDPAISNGQPEARLYMALYEGLVEYHPKTLAPQPALAEHWHINNDSSEFTFHLRRNGRWSNGDPIDANDFVYSFRRALAKETASRNAYLASYIKYAQAYHQRAVFVRDPQTVSFFSQRISTTDPA